MASNQLHAEIHAEIDPTGQVPRIRRHPGERCASRHRPTHSVAGLPHLSNMSNHSIATPITTWAEARATDREVLNRSEVAALLAVDARTLDRGIEDGTIPAVHVGRRVLIPRRPFLRAFGVSSASEEVSV